MGTGGGCIRLDPPAGPCHAETTNVPSEHITASCHPLRGVSVTPYSCPPRAPQIAAAGSQSQKHAPLHPAPGASTPLPLLPHWPRNPGWACLTARGGGGKPLCV